MHTLLPHIFICVLLHLKLPFCHCHEVSCYRVRGVVHPAINDIKDGREAIIAFAFEIRTADLYMLHLKLMIYSLCMLPVCYKAIKHVIDFYLNLFISNILMHMCFFRSHLCNHVSLISGSDFYLE